MFYITILSSQLNKEGRPNECIRFAHFWTPACSGHKFPREAGVIRGEAPCDAPVSVPGEPEPDGSRVLCFMSSCVRAGCTLLTPLMHCFPSISYTSLIGRRVCV